MKKRCKFTKPNGDQCKLYAVDDTDYCRYHTDANVSVQPEHNITAGIPLSKKQSYTEFYNNWEPTDLKREQATLRSLLDDLLKLDELNSESWRSHLSSLLSSKYKEWFISQSIEEDIAEHFTREFTGITFEILNKELPDVQMTKQNLYAAKDLIAEIRKTAETIKKIQEGFTINVTGDIRMFAMFLKECVFANVNDMRIKYAIAESAKGFLSRVESNQVLLEAPVEGIEETFETIGDILSNESV